LESELDEWPDSGEEAFIREGIEAQCLRVEKMLGLLVRFLAVEDVQAHGVIYVGKY
jgi:hypothetical protein